MAGTKPKKGDKIKVTRNGLEVVDVTDNRVWVKDSEGTTRSYYFSDIDFTVTEVAKPKPDYWPPKANDIWKSESYNVTYHVLGSKGYRTTYSGSVSSGISAEEMLKYPDLRLIWRDL